jgi:hypothetical protein
MPDWLRRAMAARPDVTRRPVQGDSRGAIPTIGPARGMRGVPVPRGEAQGVGTPSGSVPILDAAARDPRQTALDVLTSIPAVELPASVGAATASALSGDAAGTAAYGLAALPLVGMPSFVKRGIEAWHGSPHKFDRFDISKIGGGEGSQVFGHGLYFAEHPEVGKYYRETLAPGRGAKPRDIAARVFNSLEGPADERAASTIRELARRAANSDDPVFKQRMMDAIAEAEKGGLTGYLYRVNLDVDPEELLDLDAIYRDMPAYVQDALRKAGAFDIMPYRPSTFPEEGLTLPNGAHIKQVKGDEYSMRTSNGNNFTLRWSDVSRIIGDPRTGEGAYMALSRNLGGDPQASAALKEAGVPGLRYLDQWSRMGNTGTRNYVMFDDKRINILERLAALGLLAGGSGAIAAKAAKTQKDQKDSQ